MLRITARDESTIWRLRLEGRLAGESVAEAERTWAGAPAGKAIEVDLRGVTGTDAAGRGRAGLEAQGLAYVRFALANPGHYRVMFGGFVAKANCDPELTTEASGAFGVLLAALAELQEQGVVREGDPEALALFVWSAVHGVAMLAIDGQLTRPGRSLDQVPHLIVQRIWDGIAAPDEPRRAAGR